MRCRVKNWRSFQHYKDRNPPWIKLHFSLLTSSDWVALADSDRVLAIVCMLIASRNEGEIDCSESGLEYMKRVAYLNKRPNVNALIECGFLNVASNTEQEIQDARPEAEDIKLQKDLNPPSPPEGKGLNGNGTNESRAARKKPATRAPDSFEITEPMWGWAQEQGVAHERIETETAKFLDHHKAKGSLFSDWPAAWRKWMRNVVEFAAAKR